MSRSYGIKQRISPPTITLASRCSIGGALSRGGVGAAATGVSPWSDAISGLLAFPFVVEVPTLVNKFFWVNGSAVGGNTDMALYNEAFVKIGTATGSVAGVTNNIPQAASPASPGAFTIPPGLYYCAITHSATTTNQLFRWSLATLGIPFWMSQGCWKMASQAVGSTPATATPGDLTNIAFPLCGIITRSVFDA